jgi:ribosomal-protein-alanine N-acetyltransferase
MNTAPMTKPRVRVHIRWMIRRDFPSVLAIESACPPTPWGEDDFLPLLRQRNCIGMVAEIGERVAGFLIYSLYKDFIEINNFAVDPAWRRAGIGQQMATYMVGKLASHRRTRITLAVRETNLSAQLFFRSQGFQATDVVRDCYAEPHAEDWYTMEYLLGD